MAKPHYIEEQLADEIDTLVPDPQVCKEFGVTSMTIWRWDHDPELAKLGWSPPVVIRKRKFRIRKPLEKFKKNLLRRAIETRNAKARECKKSVA